MYGVVPALKVGQKLGNGHFGEVFLGVDGVHGQVAIKVLSRKPQDTAPEWLRYKAGFLAEAQNPGRDREHFVKN